MSLKHHTQEQDSIGRVKGGSNMADKELEGASLPTGIEVDDAAAYFGVIESSDMVHTLMAMEQEKAMEQFFSILSDVVLLPGDFDFEAASERIQCEGGEIYYLVAGHLGLMSLPDPLSQYLGLPDSSGESSGQSPSLSEEEQGKLATLADPMRILKLLAIASTTGSEGEVTRYLNTLKQLFADPASHKATLLAVADELDASLDVAGHALPVPSLASGKAAAAPIASASVSLPKPTPKPEPVEEVPLPPAPQVEKEVDLPDLPLPSEVSSAVELPSVEPVAVAEPVLDTNNERMVARAEEDAFSGAFDLGLGKEEPEVIASEPTPEPVEETIQEPELEPAPEPVEEVPEPAEEEEFVSAAEHFLAADTDGSRELSVEELAVATGTSLEEAKELHEQFLSLNSFHPLLLRKLSRFLVRSHLFVNHLHNNHSLYNNPFSNQISNNKAGINNRHNSNSRAGINSLLNSSSNRLGINSLLNSSSNRLGINNPSKAGINLNNRFNQQSVQEFIAEVAVSGLTHTGDSAQFVARRAAFADQSHSVNSPLVMS
jgi:hypothetical protein